MKRNLFLILKFSFLLEFYLLFFFIITIYRGIKNFRIANRPFELLPMFLGLIFVFVFLEILYKNERIDSSPIVLRANYDGDINGFSLEFRKDGTYKFCNYSVLGGKYFRGKYLMKDSIITLDRNNIDDVIRSNQLAIRKISENYNGREYKIVQINKNHQRIENEYFDFVITIDKRNK